MELKHTMPTGNEVYILRPVNRDGYISATTPADTAGTSQTIIIVTLCNARETGKLGCASPSLIAARLNYGQFLCFGAGAPFPESKRHQV